MNKKDNTHRRIRWRVVRQGGKWTGVVLIGEEPLRIGPFTSKHTARDAARARAAVLKLAGQ